MVPTDPTQYSAYIDAYRMYVAVAPNMRKQLLEAFGSDYVRAERWFCTSHYRGRKSPSLYSGSTGCSSVESDRATQKSFRTPPNSVVQSPLIEAQVEHLQVKTKVLQNKLLNPARQTSTYKAALLSDGGVPIAERSVVVTQAVPQHLTLSPADQVTSKAITASLTSTTQASEREMQWLAEKQRIEHIQHKLLDMTKEINSVFESVHQSEHPCGFLSACKLPFSKCPAMNKYRIKDAVDVKRVNEIRHRQAGLIKELNTLERSVGNYESLPKKAKVV